MGLVNNLYIYVIDGSQGLLGNPVDWLDSLFTINEILVVSVSDMVNKIETRLGRGRKIQNLFIGGHGAPGYQSVGAGSGWDTTGAFSLQVDSSNGLLLGTAEAQMNRLGRNFAPNAIVTLGGCQVGRDTILLKAVSKSLGSVPVQAGTANQRPLVPGMEGAVIRCTSTSTCTNMGTSYWASPGSLIQ